MAITFSSVVSGITDFLGSETAANIGTAIQAGATVVAGRQQAKELKRQAELTRRAGEFEVARLRESEERLQARQRVRFAKSGVRRTGSVLEVMRQTAQEAEEEALNIQFGAESGAQARLFEAKQVKRAGQIAGLGTLLTGFGG